MSTKAITEFDAKQLLFKFFDSSDRLDVFPLFSLDTQKESLFEMPAWVFNTKLVVKPDQLVKRRGKLGLIGVGLSAKEAIQWIQSKAKSEVKIGNTVGRLSKFLIEPFYAHEQSEEMYVSIVSTRLGEDIFFCEEGGVDVGDVNKKAAKISVKVDEKLDANLIKTALLPTMKRPQQTVLTAFIEALYEFYKRLHFSFLEINPFVINNAAAEPTIRVLDIAAKLDEAAQYQCMEYWSGVHFPAPFGREQTPEEEFVSRLDGKTGASLKLTVLNPRGLVWTLVAGGGASVIFTDTILALAKDKDILGNYGEYSGAPSRSLTYQFARTVISLMTRHEELGGKSLIIGGGIANFTNVADTFDGVIEAIEEKAGDMRRHAVSVFVRRGGPNYQQALEKIERVVRSHNIPIQVYGPEMHMTSIVPMSLGINNESLSSNHKDFKLEILPRKSTSNDEFSSFKPLFDENTKSIVYGMQPKAVQNMLDFDYLCRRSPSVSCIVYTFALRDHYQQFFFGAKELVLPVYSTFEKAIKKHSEVTVAVNFASSRSALESSLEMMDHPEIKVISIIAEGVPERHTKLLISESRKRGVVVIGPATVGMIKPGCFRMGNTGGKTDNLISSKLHDAGSVGYVSRSGGLSNELNNIIAHTCDGVYEGIAIGGDKYPISTFLDFLRRFERDDKCKMMVLLGEVGGVLEHEVADALRRGEFSKPLVAWCTGSSAECFPYDVQFGHAGACAGGKRETATAKNAVLKAAGALVPDSFEQFPFMVEAVYNKLVQRGDIVSRTFAPPPKMPMDYEWASQLGLIRKRPNFFSSIVNERNGELSYAGVPITTVLESGVGIGGVIGLIWFKRRVPKYMAEFFEMVLMVIADHGPCVSGAHNAIVTARAGKDVISSLISGLVTIGPRFGGALDGAAKIFSWGLREGLSPGELVNYMRKEKRLIMGIGHKKKSLEDPDKRVEIIINFCRKYFSSNTILDYALEVEKITTRKKSNLILNVDGAIGVCFADCLKSTGLFSQSEIDDYIEQGSINALFVLGRSIGLIGHFLDQNRLQQPLYRHPTDDIAFIDDYEAISSDQKKEHTDNNTTANKQNLKKGVVNVKFKIKSEE